MEADQIALQQALLSQSTISLQTTAIIVTAQFTLFFGYFGALFIFLRHMSVGVRIASFLVMAMSNIFLTIGHMGVFFVQNRNLQWRAQAISEGILPEYFTPESIAVYERIGSVTQFMFYTLVVASTVFLFYMTFFHKWGSGK